MKSAHLLSKTKTPTILVVDDDTDMVRLLKECLELRGYNVLTGFDGQMAIHHARASKPGLIIMDVNMPVTNGLKALEYLRESPLTANIPVIILSGASADLVHPAIEKSSRVAFLRKPVDLTQLESIVLRILPIPLDD